MPYLSGSIFDYRNYIPKSVIAGINHTISRIYQPKKTETCLFSCIFLKFLVCGNVLWRSVCYGPLLDETCIRFYISCYFHETYITFYVSCYLYCASHIVSFTRLRSTRKTRIPFLPDDNDFAFSLITDPLVWVLFDFLQVSVIYVTGFLSTESFLHVVHKHILFCNHILPIVERPLARILFLKENFTRCFVVIARMLIHLCTLRLNTRPKSSKHLPM